MIFSRLALSRSSKIVLASLSILLGLNTARAEETSVRDLLGLSGSVRKAYWAHDKNFSGNNDFGVGSVWLNLKPSEVYGTKLYADAYVQAQDLTRTGYSEGFLREAYLEKSFGAVDLRVGRQIIVWGRADKANPTDNLTVKNMKKLFTDDEDQRLGVFATQATYNFEAYRISAIWLSEWISPVYPIVPQTGINISDYSPNNPQNQFALKVDRSGGSVDWSLSYFDGYSKSPNLAYLGSGASGVSVGLTYDHIQTVGADFATTWGDTGLRGEVASTKTSDDAGTDFLKQNSFVSAVFGGDRSFFENFNLNAQLLYKHINNFQDPNSQPVAALSSLTQSMSVSTQTQVADQAGFSLRPSYKMYNDTLEMEVAYVTWFYKSDSVLKPKVTYALSDRWKAIVGGEFYSGPKDSFFGQLKDASSIFTEARLIF